MSEEPGDNTPVKSNYLTRRQVLEGMTAGAVAAVVPVAPFGAWITSPPDPAPLSASERKILGALDAERATRDLQYFSTGVVKTLSGAGAGTAVVGSPEARALADAIEQKMRQLGLAVHRDPFPCRAYSYAPVTCTAGGRTVPAISLHAAGGTWGIRDGVPYTRGNAADGHRVHARLADAGDGYAPDYARLGSVRGRAVLVRRGGAWPTLQILEAAHQGAAALLLYGFPGAQPEAIRQDSMWYHEQLPTVSISIAEAQRLQQAMRNGPLAIVLENRIDYGDGTDGNLIGTLTGNEFPDEYITVSAHYDRWWHAANDNCAGVATMLEIARVLSAGYRPRRTLLFIATGGEEAGVEATEEDWLCGSHAFVRSHPEVMRRLVYDFNIDLAGWTAPNGTLSTTPEVAATQRQLLADLGLDKRVSVQPGLRFVTDAWNFGTVGGGSAGILDWGAGGLSHAASHEPLRFDSIYHTNLDVYHPERFKNLPDHLRFGALSVLRMDGATVVPIRFSAVADWASPKLDADASRAGGVSFAAARAALAEFRTQAERVEAAAAGIAAPAQARLLNRWIMRTRKNLMPWLYGGFSGDLRTSGYAATYAALSAARAAAVRGDRAATLAALEGARGLQLQLMSQVAPEVARAERLYWYSNGDWSIAYQQKQRPVGEGLIALYVRLHQGGAAQAEADELRQYEAEARGDLSEAIFLLTGKLSAAAADLRDSPVSA